jgi:hypothetical protein
LVGAAGVAADTVFFAGDLAAVFFGAGAALTALADLAPAVLPEVAVLPEAAALLVAAGLAAGALAGAFLVADPAFLGLDATALTVAEDLPAEDVPAVVLAVATVAFFAAVTSTSFKGSVHRSDANAPWGRQDHRQTPVGG